MKAFFALLLLASIACGLTGCAENYEDKAFFETGWRHPGDNDRRMNQ